MAVEPTEEQQAACDAFATGKDLALVAGPGPARRPHPDADGRVELGPSSSAESGALSCPSQPDGPSHGLKA